MGATERIHNRARIYYFEISEPRRLRVTYNYFKKNYPDITEATHLRFVVDWNDMLIERLNGGPVAYPEGMMSFREWLAQEFEENGLFITEIPDPAKPYDPRACILLLAQPNEAWAIYRIQMMAKHSLKELDLPWFDAPEWDWSKPLFE